MPEEFDFSELRNYLQGQIDLGDFDILLDEPWALTKKAAVSAPRPAALARPMPVMPPQSSNVGAPELVMGAPTPVASAAPAASTIPNVPVMDGMMPAARPVKKAVAAYENSASLEVFYGDIAAEAIYSGSDIFRYEGPEHPKLLLLLPAPQPQIPAGQFLTSSTGEMISRLFASLNIEQSNIGVTFFYKSAAARNLTPLLETVLRKMLTKELSFIAPAVMVTFGENLFHQVFGKGKNFNDLAGTDLEFNGVKTCSLVDAFAMENDKQLKWLTWKVHIPRGSYFKA